MALKTRNLDSWMESMALNLGRRPDTRFLLWLHGASVGETLSLLPIARALLRHRHTHVLITSGTVTALKRVQMEPLGDRVTLQIRPADSVSVAQRFLGHWRPDAIIFAESVRTSNL
eukprot:6205059-Pleurochrysis_carterae.AAC.1